MAAVHITMCTEMYTQSSSYVSKTVPSQSYDIGRLFNSTCWWKGNIDELVIYNKSLTDDDIRNIYNAKSLTWQGKIAFGCVEGNGSCTNLAGWQKMIPIVITNNDSLARLTK